MTSDRTTAVAIDKWIRRCSSRLRLGQFLTTVADWLAIYFLVLGTAVLAVKLIVPQIWPEALWLACGAVPVAFAAWWSSGRSSFTEAESVAVLDRRLQAGGLLMTVSEAPDERWREYLPQLDELWHRSLPQLRPKRFARQMVIPLAFLAGACLVPERELQASSRNNGTAGQMASSQLEELLADFKEAELLKEEEEQQLSDEITKLADDTQHAPLTHEKWETVDALRAKLQARVDETSARFSQAQDALAALKAAVSGESPDLSAEDLESMEKDAIETLQKLSQNGGLKGASAGLQSKLQRLMKQGQLPEDPAERNELMNDLREFLDKEADELSELRSKCKQCGECQGQNPGQCQTQGQCQGNRPGRGGVNRGRGDAELTWGDESTEQDTKFKETVLPPGLSDKPRDEVIGLSASAPEVNPAAAAPRSAARREGVATGAETWNRNVRPRHRPILRQYFDQPETRAE